jgi:hypothetical protein
MLPSERRRPSRTPASVPHRPASSSLCGGVNLFCSRAGPAPSVDPHPASALPQGDSDRWRARQRRSGRDADVRQPSAGRCHSTVVLHFGESGLRGFLRVVAQAVRVAVSAQERFARSDRWELPAWGWPRRWLRRVRSLPGRVSARCSTRAAARSSGLRSCRTQRAICRLSTMPGRGASA